MLRASGMESESELAFSGLADLLDLCSASWGHSPSHKQPLSGARWRLGHPSPVTRWR